MQIIFKELPGAFLSKDTEVRAEEYSSTHDLLTLVYMALMAIKRLSQDVAYLFSTFCSTSTWCGPGSA